jgi:hypothetical protein
VRTQAAKHLAAVLGADPNSADHAHFGRLAGFTNRKPERAIEGRPPFVMIDQADGQRIAQSGPVIVREALASLAAERQKQMIGEVKAAAEKLPQPARAWAKRASDLGQWYAVFVKGLEGRFGADFDASRADWMAATALIGKGYDVDSVADAIAKHSPGAKERKGADLEDYVVATAGKAEIWVELRAQGADYADVKDRLLPLARERQAERVAEQERRAALEQEDDYGAER